MMMDEDGEDEEKAPMATCEHRSSFHGRQWEDETRIRKIRQRYKDKTDPGG